MSTANLDSADLKAVLAGGLLREDVMNEIFDVSEVDLPFTSRAKKGTHDNEYTEWTTDKLAAPNLNNAVIDGADIVQNDTVLGKRLGNHSQISVKAVKVSSRADASDTIGFAKALGYQIDRRGAELRRDIESTALTGQASVADDGATIAGKSAGVFAFCSTNKDVGATGSIPGFNTTTKVFGAIVQGTKRGLTETMVKAQVKAVYNGGSGDRNKMLTLMSTPDAIEKLNDYYFTSGAKIATLTEDVGTGTEPATAKGVVTVVTTPFGMIEMVPNRLQPIPAAGVANVLIADWDYIELSYLRGFQTEALAKTGLAENWMMDVDWSLKVLNDAAIAAILDIDTTIAVVG